MPLILEGIFPESRRVEVIILIVVVVIAIVFLKGFDRVAGRGPKQVKDGINKSSITRDDAHRIPCPECAEMILPAAKKCPFCRSDIKNS